MKKLLAVILTVLMIISISVPVFAGNDEDEKYIALYNYSDHVIMELYLNTNTDDDSMNENLLVSEINNDGDFFECLMQLNDDDTEFKITIVDDEGTCTEFYFNADDFSEFVFNIITTDDYPICLADMENEPYEPDFVTVFEEEPENELEEDYDPDDNKVYIEDEEEQIKYRYENVHLIIENHLGRDITSAYVKPSKRDHWSGNMIRSGYYIPVGSTCYLDGTIWYDEDCKWDLYVYTRGGGWFTCKNLSFKNVSDPYNITIAAYRYSDGTYGHDVY